MKKYVLALILVVAGAAAALLATGWRPRLGGTQPPPVERLTLVSGGTGGWPVDQSWTWTFPMPADAPTPGGIGLRVRQKTTVRTPNSTVAVRAQNAAMPASEASRSFGTGRQVYTSGAERPKAGRVTLQLLDLDQAGVASARPGQSLRLLGQLTTGFVTTPVAGDDTYLPAGRIAGRSVRGEGDWSNGELYLMTFYVESEGQVHQYDAFLEMTAGGP